MSTWGDLRATRVREAIKASFNCVCSESKRLTAVAKRPVNKKAVRLERLVVRYVSIQIFSLYPAALSSFMIENA